MRDEVTVKMFSGYSVGRDEIRARTAKTKRTLRALRTCLGVARIGTGDVRD